MKRFWIALACVVTVGLGSYAIPKAYEAHQNKMANFHQQQKEEALRQEIMKAMAEANETLKFENEYMAKLVQLAELLLKNSRMGSNVDAQMRDVQIKMKQSESNIDEALKKVEDLSRKLLELQRNKHNIANKK